MVTQTPLSIMLYVHFLPCSFFFFRNGPARAVAVAASLLRFLDHTQLDTHTNTHTHTHTHTHTYKSGRTPLKEWSFRRRASYLHDTQTQGANIHSPAGFEPAMSGISWPQTCALDHTAFGNGTLQYFPSSSSVCVQFYVIYTPDNSFLVWTRSKGIPIPALKRMEEYTHETRRPWEYVNKLH
jgi:hypothetical protein